MDGTTIDRLARGLATRFNRRTAAKLIPGAILISAAPLRAEATTVCGAGETNCRGICTTMQDDPVFCGSCDNTCDTGACANATCVSCEEIGQDSCPNANGTFYCTDLQTDPFNCGACAEGSDANFCGSQVCQDGQCVSTAGCEAGLTECRGQCVDLLTDVSHCGGCFGECYGGESLPGVCVDGECTQCDALGLSYCNGPTDDSFAPYCADFESDPNNCGDCNVVCEDGVCTNGSCSDVILDEATPGAIESSYTDDADAIAFALQLDQFALALLRHGLDTLPKADFESYSTGSRSLLSVMRVHDKAHVALISEWLTALGGSTPDGPVIDADLTAIADVGTFVSFLEVVKEMTVSAHLGIIAALSDPSLAADLAGITTVESRDAAILATLMGVTPFTGVTDQPRTRAQVIAALTGNFDSL